jgi:hypothetical protein
MAQTRVMTVGLVFLSYLACLPAQAQTTQFLPEIDSYLRVDSRVRLYLEAKDDRDGGDSEQFTFGPSVQISLKPLIRLKNATRFDLDDAKSRPLVLESGYRSITAPNTPIEDRAIEAVTFRLPPWGGAVISDRNRVDLDWKAGSFTWRYRNKLTVERTFSIGSHHFIPYVAAEPFYQSQYKKWSTTDLYVGCLLPFGKHVELNPYFEFENDTGKSPNRQQYYVGLALYLYFSRKSN